ncbi:MAG: hypothetical protein DMG04_00045 [Acidobacteria bacterium]|nr:MAG: hypothetical protein DMG04_00045 [Acidobacteriota bacterium]
MMKVKVSVVSIFTAALFVGSAARVSAAPPPAPAQLAPAAGASVQEPFTISWSSVSDPSGIVAYNWQVSSSSSFTPVVLQNSTNGQTTAGTVSGLANGTYFWRVQAVNGAFEQGAWSAARSFSVTGVGPGAPGTPSLGPPKGYSTFHPYEVMTFNWTAAAGAVTYVFQAATDPSFPVVTRIQFDNIPNTTYSFAIGNPEGNYFARVLAVNANGVFSAPSNVISFSVFFNNPVPPALTRLSPPDGVTLTLPITLTWSASPNPQPSGYDLQIARDSNFQSIEDLDSQLNDPTRTVLSLTPGQKFWRVHSVQGDASPTTAAVTPWSTTGTFTVSSAPPTPVSVSSTTDPLTSGDTTWLQLQLTGAPPTPTSIALTSSNSSAAPVPASITMPANIAWTQFQMQAGQVASATPVTITATLNGKSASGNLTVAPTALKSLSISPSTINGGAQAGAIVMLSGQAPAGGASVTLASNSAAVSPPPSVFVNPGSFSVSFPLQTNSVTANTSAVVTASWNGTSMQAPVTVTPQPAPASLTLDPTSTVGTGGSSFGRVTVASAQPTDTIFQLTSSHPAASSTRSHTLGIQRQPEQRDSGQLVDRDRHAVERRAVGRRGRQPDEQPAGRNGAGERHGRGRRDERHVPDHDVSQFGHNHRAALGHAGEHHALQFANREPAVIVTATTTAVIGNGDADGDGERPQRRADHVDADGHQRHGRQQRIRHVSDRRVDHPQGRERTRRRLVGRLFERREQNEELHVHAQRQRVSDRQRAMRSEMLLG